MRRTWITLTMTIPMPLTVAMTLLILLKRSGTVKACPVIRVIQEKILLSLTRVKKRKTVLVQGNYLRIAVCLFIGCCYLYFHGSVDFL